MWALLRKEAQELGRWLPLAWLGFGYAVFGALSTLETDYVYFITSQLAGNVATAALLLAVAIGLLQSIPDERNASRMYLMHRGVTAGQVFLSKVLVGILFYALTCLVPLALAAWWLDVLGPEYATTSAIQVWPAIVCVMTAFAAYPTMMIMVYRPARWLGTRALPVAIPACVMLMVAPAAMDFSLIDALLLLTLPALLIVVARYNFVHAAALPAPASRSSWSFLNTCVLLAACICLQVGLYNLMRLPFRALSGSVTDARYAAEKIKEDGTPWFVMRVQEWSEKSKRFRYRDVAGDEVAIDRPIDLSRPLTENITEADVVTLPRKSQEYWQIDIAFRRGQNNQSISGWTEVYDRRGYMLYYHQSYSRNANSARPLQLVLGKDGFRSPDSDWGRPFATHQLPNIETILKSGDAHYSSTLRLIRDDEGVYQLDEDNRQLRTLLATDNIYVTATNVGSQMRLYVRRADRVDVYRLADIEGSDQWLNEFELATQMASLGKGNGIPTPELRAEPIGSIELPPQLGRCEVLRLAYITPNKWTIIGSPDYAPRYILRALGDGQPIIQYPVSPPLIYKSSGAEIVRNYFFLPGVYLALNAYNLQRMTQAIAPRRWDEVTGVSSEQMPWAISSWLLQTILSLTLTVNVARRRMIGKLHWPVWIAICVLVGLAAPVALLAAYPRIAVETCPHCNRKRRVDWERCEKCGGNWEAAAPQGVEIRSLEDSEQSVNASWTSSV